MKYLITGGHGFLGRHLVQSLNNLKIDHRATVRGLAGPNEFSTSDLNVFTSWPQLFESVDVVIHTAAKAHDMSGAKELKEIYQNTNFNLTVKLAEEAKKYGVKKFIFLSTIKVNGELTTTKPFTAEDIPAPQDDYGKSKLQAELALLQLQQPGVFDIVIIRPCLIYGEGVKANFSNLIKLVKRNLPLPFGLLKNKRSFVSVDNLIDFILVTAKNPAANGQIFLVSDGHDITLTELITSLATAPEQKVILLPIPPWMMRLGLFLIGRSDLSQRLFSSLQVDIEKSQKLLNWQPRVPMAQSLQKMLSV